VPCATSLLRRPAIACICGMTYFTPSRCRTARITRLGTATDASRSGAPKLQIMMVARPRNHPVVALQRRLAAPPSLPFLPPDISERPSSRLTRRRDSIHRFDAGNLLSGFELAQNLVHQRRRAVGARSERLPCRVDHQQALERQSDTASTNSGAVGLERFAPIIERRYRIRVCAERPECELDEEHMRYACCDTALSERARCVTSSTPNPSLAFTGPVRRGEDPFAFFVCGGKLGGKLSRVASRVASQSQWIRTGCDGTRWKQRPQHLEVVSGDAVFLVDVGGVDGTRTRGLRRDRPAF
jgi:hypothetical protein